MQLLTRRVVIQRITYAILLFCSYFHCSLDQVAHAANETEYQLKAAFTFNFLKFTYFPEQSLTHTIRLCVTADAAALPYFKAIDNKKFDNNTIIVREIGLDQLKDCDAVFLPADSLEATSINLLKDLPVLTIGESNSFLKLGGMIQFFLEDGKMRFKISRKNAEANGIRFSSKLLRIAEVIGE